MDAFPVFSQIKSLVQALAGDKTGAKQTQVNFSRQCIVVSQVRSAVEALKGDEQAARETQKQFLSVVEKTVNAVPVVGHVKGALHYATKNRERGDAAMKASSRTTGVIVAGAVGFVAGGPVGSVAGGVTGGAIMDGVITAADSVVHKKFRPHGNLEIIQDPKNPGKWVDVIGSTILDGVVGKAAGSAVPKIQPIVLKRVVFLDRPSFKIPVDKIQIDKIPIDKIVSCYTFGKKVKEYITKNPCENDKLNENSILENRTLSPNKNINDSDGENKILALGENINDSDKENGTLLPKENLDYSDGENEILLLEENIDDSDIEYGTLLLKENIDDSDIENETLLPRDNIDSDRENGTLLVYQRKI